MKPLPRENTIWEFPRAHLFVIWGTFVTVSSRVHILSTFYRIFKILALHFGALGTTFRDQFFRSKNIKLSFYIPLLGGGHLGPHREKGGTVG